MLRVNLDETSVAYWQGGSSGNVFASKRRLTSKFEPVQQVTRSQLRGALTHVGIICDHPGIQSHLPQYILTNEKLVSKKDEAALTRSLPPNAILRRGKSGWTNNMTMLVIVKALGAALKLVASDYQAIFFMDAPVQSQPRSSNIVNKSSFVTGFARASNRHFLRTFNFSCLATAFFSVAKRLCSVFML